MSNEINTSSNPSSEAVKKEEEDSKKNKEKKEKEKEDEEEYEEIIKESPIIPYNLFNIPIKKNFKNPDYIIKFSNQSNIKFMKDELTIQYCGKGYNLIDYATVQSDKPINIEDPIFYYEIEILNDGNKCDITLGFADKEVVKNKQCGLMTNSFGYNGNGKKYHEDIKDTFGPKWNKGDIIGCGLFFSKKSIFYTHNGKFIDYAFNKVNCNIIYYPTISLHSLNECVKVNFGKKFFLFDIEGLYYDYQKNKIKELYNEESQILDLDFIVKDYLVNNSYLETVNILDNESHEKKEDKMEIDETNKISDNILNIILKNNSEVNKDKLNTFLINREKIKNAFMKNDYDNVLDLFTNNFSDFSNNSSYKKIYVIIITIKYLNALKSENDYLKAFDILNNLDKDYFNESFQIYLYNDKGKEFLTNLKNLSTLICYPDLQKSQFKYYLEKNQIDLLESQVNKLMLEMFGIKGESILEEILKQQECLNLLDKNIKGTSEIIEVIY